MSTQPKFNRPEEDRYIDWLDSLPECTRCNGTGTIESDAGFFERTCFGCDGQGVIFPEDEDCDEYLEGWPCRAGFATG